MRPPTSGPGVAWRHARGVASRVVALLEPLEPAAQRRVLGAVCMLLGHERLAAELALGPRPAPDNGEPPP